MPRKDGRKLMYKILMMIQVIIMKILAKCKFGGETMIRQFAKFSLPPKLVVIRYLYCDELFLRII